MMYIFEHRDLLEHMRYDDLHITELDGHAYNAHRCGYVTPKGTFFDCEPYHHIDMLRDFVEGSYKELFDAFMERYMKLEHRADINHSIYDMFFMVEMEWVKIAAYLAHNTENSIAGPAENKTYDWKVERFFDLTPEQTAVIYPT